MNNCKHRDPRFFDSVDYAVTSNSQFTNLLVGRTVTLISFRLKKIDERMKIVIAA
jgi:hypothetical protein